MPRHAGWGQPFGWRRTRLEREVGNLFFHISLGGILPSSPSAASSAERTKVLVEEKTFITPSFPTIPSNPNVVEGKSWCVLVELDKFNITFHATPRPIFGNRSTSPPRWKCVAVQILRAKDHPGQRPFADNSADVTLSIATPRRDDPDGAR